MTIRVEREALLRVISRAPSTPASTRGPLIQSKQQQDDDEFVIVELPDAKLYSFFYDDLIPESTDEDDQASLCTLSTDSVTTATSSSTLDDQRRVSFAPELVTEVWTREKTLPQDIPLLFYSSNETQTFRQEYRFERKVLNELSIDPETFPGDEEELSILLAKASPASTALSSSFPGSPNASRHCISRVVVLHNDKLETFFDKPENDLSASEPVQEDFLSCLISSPFEEQQGSGGSTSLGSSDFFDNDSFWSGSLTWY